MPNPPRTAVLPFPKGSHANPTRGAKRGVGVSLSCYVGGTTGFDGPASRSAAAPAAAKCTMTRG